MELRPSQPPLFFVTSVFPNELYTGWRIKGLHGFQGPLPLPLPRPPSPHQPGDMDVERGPVMKTKES